MIWTVCVNGNKPSALWLTFSAFARGKVNKRASQDRRHGRPDRSWKKQRQTHEEPFYTESESGKLATPQLWQIRLMSALLRAKISRELACRGNRAHANMHAVQTCACNGWWQAGYQFLTSLSGAKSLIKILAHSRQITFIIWQDSVHRERKQHYFGIKKKIEWGNSSRLNAIPFQLVFPAQWVIFTGTYWHKAE